MAVLAGVGVLAIAAVVVIAATTGGGEAEPAGQEADAGPDRAGPAGPREQRSDARPAERERETQSPRPPEESTRSGDRPSGGGGDERESADAAAAGVREAIEGAAVQDRSGGPSPEDEFFGAGSDGLRPGEAERLLQQLEDERE